MTLSSTLHSAMSGLVAAGRMSTIVSDNVANAMTPGFAKRSVVLGSNAETGPGVQVLGVKRHSDPALVANRRAADAQYAAADTLADFHARFAKLVGSGGNETSIGERLSDFENSLLTAASRPDSAQRLDEVSNRAKALAAFISDAAEGLRTVRTEADRKIGTQVDRLNHLLAETKELNRKVTTAAHSGANTASLLDQRQKIVDEINQMVPVNVVSRDHGQIALYSDGGAILLDGLPATLEFSASNDTMPHMTAANGLLSGLTVNGTQIRTDGSANKIAGGSLSELFQIRDELTVSAQEDLDTVARDLIERFEDPALDPSLTAGSPGLFTDSGSAFDASAVVGLANRLEINAAVDPSQGGESWKLRAGLGATSAGEPGEARLLSRFTDALGTKRVSASFRFGTGALSAADFGASLMSRAAQNDSLANQTLSFAATSRSEMSRIELEQGVDTDAELQTLMIVEQSYAANARIIQAVDDMMQTLLRL